MSKSSSHYARWANIAREPEANFRRIARALANFGGRPEAVDLNELLILLQGIGRGEALLKQAVSWSEPFAGRRSGLSELRGKQWRLVMTYAGFEIILQSLYRKDHPGIHEFRELELKLGNLDGLQPLQAPKLSNSIKEKWMADEQLLKFLSLRGYDLKVFKRWMIDGEAADTLADQLALAKALRNGTAHAALSANKCRQLKLGDALERLPHLMARCVESAFEKLADAD